LYLRDANWDPDYVKSAKLIETLYKMESEDERNFDGIIALNPVVLENILKIISEIEIDGKVFTASNVIDLLNYETKTGYVEKGYTEDERKKIIEDFSIVLKNKIFNSDLDTVKNISYSILDSLYNKDILLYFENSNIELILDSSGIKNYEEWSHNILDECNKLFLESNWPVLCGLSEKAIKVSLSNPAILNIVSNEKCPYIVYFSKYRSISLNKSADTLWKEKKYADACILYSALISDSDLFLKMLHIRLNMNYQRKFLI